MPEHANHVLCSVAEVRPGQVVSGLTPPRSAITKYKLITLPTSISFVINLTPVSYTHLDVYKRQT